MSEQRNNQQYLTLLQKIQAQLAELKTLGSSVQLGPVLDDIHKVNDLALRINYPQPYPDKLIDELQAMQNRVDYFNRTGLDAPSLSVVKND